MTARNALCIANNIVQEFPAGDAHALSTGGTGVSVNTPAALLTALGAMQVSNNLSDLASIATALGNLGFTYSVNGNAWVATLATSGRTWILQGNSIVISADAAVYFPNALSYLSEPHIINANGQTSTAVYKVGVDTLSRTGFAARGRVIQNGGTVAAFTGGVTIHYGAIGW